MSTFDEEKNSIEMVRRFLYDLMDPTVTPKVPLHIRKRARQVIKHYPLSLDMFIDRCYNELSKEMHHES